MTYPPPQPQQPPQWGAQPPPPQWGGPPQPPKKNNTGKVVGFGCLGLVLLFVLLGIIGTLVNGDGKKGDTDSPSPTPSVPVASSTAASSAAAPSSAPVVQPSPSKAAESPAKPVGGNAAKDDVQLSGCVVGDVLKWPSVKVTITNKSSKTSNYIVQVEFLDAAGVRISEGLAATNNLAPGKSAVQQAQGTAEAKGAITCAVTDVTRYASG